MMSVEVGKAPPAFVLPSEEGEVSLRELKGKKVVLYFYPKDDTTGCTKEACDFRDAMPDYGKAGAVVIGVSPDSVKRHAKFRGKYKLPFTLLADEDHTVCEKYGVWKEKSMYGRKYMGVERTTIVMDTAGKVAAIFPKVKVEGHVAAVLEAVKAAK